MLDRMIPPTEQEQLEFYHAIAQIIAPHPLTIRTADLGADKLPPYLNLEPEANPFLGCRGIRQSLAQPELFKTQLRAILRASSQFNLRLMLPMISCIPQIIEIISELSLQEVMAECRIKTPLIR